MNLRLRLLAAVALVATLIATVSAASAQGYDYSPIGTDEFQSVWERTDRPVAELRAARTWIWGPGGFTGLMQEEYAEAEGGERTVQYFDKSRMEMPWDSRDSNSPWFITQGLLATELMTGRLQLGDDTFVPYQPAEIPVAGDPENPFGPTYAVMGRFMDWEARPTGSVIHQVLDREGNIGDDLRFADYGVTDSVYVPETGHNIASVFWRLMNSSGLVYEDGEYGEGPLFQSAFYAIGFPQTEAYWTRAVVDGVERDVLLQCFERRCLTYTPGNPEGWEVESGNVGQHYYHWRYDILPGEEPIAPPVIPTSLALVADDDTIAVGDETTVTATVTGDEGASVGAGVEVTFSLADNDEGALALPDDTTVETDADGTASITVTGAAAGAGDVVATVTVDGRELTDTITITVRDDVALTVDSDDTTVAQGETMIFNATATNVSGATIPHARFNIIVDVPGGCDPGDEWENFFQITAINGDSDTQGVNDTFECVEGAFQGHWGPAGGFPFPAGLTVETSVTVEVQETSRIGDHTLTAQFVDVGAGDEGADVVLAEAVLDFSVEPAAPTS